MNSKLDQKNEIEQMSLLDLKKNISSINWKKNASEISKNCNLTDD